MTLDNFVLRDCGYLQFFITELQKNSKNHNHEKLFTLHSKAKNLVIKNSIKHENQDCSEQNEIKYHPKDETIIISHEQIQEVGKILNSHFDNSKQRTSVSHKTTGRHKAK